MFCFCTSVHRNVFLSIYQALQALGFYKPHVYQIQLLMAHFFHSLIAQYKECMGCLGQTSPLQQLHIVLSCPFLSTCSFIFLSLYLFCCEQRLIFRSLLFSMAFQEKCERDERP